MNPPAVGDLRARQVADAVGAPAVAAAVVGLGLLLGWGGVDVAASVHRIEQFHSGGFALWDPTWFGGQWTLAYSVVFTPLAAALGLPALSIAAAVVATAAFQRLVSGRGCLRPGAAGAATLAFAVGTVVETAIGQVPYLTGEAIGLAALACAASCRWVPAVVLALVSTLVSPLAGLFAGIATGGWAIDRLAGRPRRWRARDPARRRRSEPVRREGGGAVPATGRRQGMLLALVAIAAVAPIAAVGIAFPQPGVMPFSAVDATWDLVIAVGLLAAAPRRPSAIRVGLGVYAIAVVGAWALASPVGGNVGRAEDTLALPLAVAFLWGRARLLLVVVAVPLFLSAWDPAWGAMSSIPSDPATRAGYYAPLDAWLHHADPGGSAGRVEVVPTRAHWESVWVARVVPLARGWERQSDVSLDPIFYRSGGFGPLDYRRWLVGEGVRWVALAAAPLDSSGVREAQVLERGVPGLREVWHDRAWRVWAVDGSPGLSGAGAVVTASTPDTISVLAERAGTETLRVRPSGRWRLTRGAGCVRPGPGGWLELTTPRPGRVTLSVGLVGTGAGCGTG